VTRSGDVTPAWVIERLSSDEDLEAVLAIERASFTNPWTREMYLAELQNEGVSYCYVIREVVDGRSRVIGFCSFWRVLDELHLNNLAIDPAHRRGGAGTALLAEVLRQGAALGARRTTLEVRRSNEEARRLYARMGFELAGVRRGYYTNPVEDALILWRSDSADR